MNCRYVCAAYTSLAALLCGLWSFHRFVYILVFPFTSKHLQFAWSESMRRRLIINRMNGREVKHGAGAGGPLASDTHANFPFDCRLRVHT